jgi:hypothetical protein
VPAVVTLVDMPAERGGTAGRDVAQHALLSRGRPMVVAVGLAVGTHDVGDLEARSLRIHGRSSAEDACRGSA